MDIYGGEVDDLTDMNVQNESGPRAGRYLIRTHEVGSNGAVSVVDLRTGQSEIVAQDAGFRRLDGIDWTPWGTVLFAEETSGGRLFEGYFDATDPFAPMQWVARPELGLLRHEGIGATNRAVFVIDELNGGSIFKFEPTTRGDLSDGQLYALKLTDLPDDEQVWSSSTYEAKVGAFEWVALDMDQVVIDADAAADDVHATEFGRPEDVEVIGQKLYVANTSEDRVVEIDLAKEVLSSFVHAGDNVPEENRTAKVTGFNNPDNLAKGPDGRLWIVEDNVPSDIWVAGPTTTTTGRPTRSTSSRLPRTRGPRSPASTSARTRRRCSSTSNTPPRHWPMAPGRSAAAEPHRMEGPRHPTRVPGPFRQRQTRPAVAGSWVVAGERGH